MKHTLFLKKLLTVAFLIMGNAAIAQGPVNAGTINPGDSVVIYYDVTINAGATGSVSNQGTVSGGNFSNVVTDDPDTPAPNDPTVTLLNVFPLPVSFSDFRAYQKNSDIELAWKILSENNTYKYEVEKSSNGTTFVRIGDVMATGASGVIDYTFLDIHPNNGDNFYRLRVIDRDGQYKFSAVVRVNLANASQLTFYPNPVTERQINVQMNKLPKGRYEFVLYNVNGQSVFSKNIDHPGGSASEVIQLPKSLASGLYQARIKKDELVFTRSLIVYYPGFSTQRHRDTE